MQAAVDERDGFDGMSAAGDVHMGLIRGSDVRVQHGRLIDILPMIVTDFKIAALSI